MSPNDIARRLLEALSVRAQRDRLRLEDFIEEIFPGPLSSLWAQGSFAVTPPQLVPDRLNITWTDFWKELSGKLNTPLDIEVAEAIQSRIQGISLGTHQVRIYAYQAEAIEHAFRQLDPIRKALRRGNLQGVNYSPDIEVIGVIAPPGAGKTEIFESIALQLGLDANRGGLSNTTLVYIVYSMRAFMYDHIRRFVRDIAYINQKLGREVITIGVWTGETPRELRGNEIKQEFTRILGSDKCPICNEPIRVQGASPSYEIKCESGHDFSFVELSEDTIKQRPPTILLVTPEQLNFNLLRRERQVLLGRDKPVPPVLFVVDEPQSYTGVFGSHISALFREVEWLISEFARRSGLINFKPLKIALSATLPRPEEFLAKLFTVHPRKVHIVSFRKVAQRTQTQDQRGFLFVMPSERHWGYRSVIVELPVVLAAVLPRDYRRVLVFVDSVELANRLKYMIEDYIRRPDGFNADYQVEQYAGRIYASDLVVNGRYNPNWARVAVHYAELSREERREVEEGLRNGTYNIVIATPTLELGIDVGEIAGCVMIGFPPTPDKFVQRAGRAGRRIPALVVVVGNPANAVDRWYFADPSRIMRYLQMAFGYAPQIIYELPLNPANLEVIRRWFGNHIVAYALSYNIRRARDYTRLEIINANTVYRQNCISSYLNAHCSRIQNELNNTSNSRLDSIGQFMSNLANEIQQQLEQRLNELASASLHVYDIEGLIIPDTRLRIQLRQYLGFEPSAINFRHTNPTVSICIAYPEASRSSVLRGTIKCLKEVEVDVARACFRYSFNAIRGIITPLSRRLPPLYEPPQRRSRSGPTGSIHYVTVQGKSLVCEVTAILEYSIPSVQEFQQFAPALSQANNSINIIRNVCLGIDNDIARTLTGMSILPRVAWFNKLAHVVGYVARASRIMPRALKPYRLLLEPVNQIFVDSLPSGQIVATGLRGGRGRVQVYPCMPWFSYVRSRHNGIAFARRLSPDYFTCPNCGQRASIRFYYDRGNRDLVLECTKCRYRWSCRGRIPNAIGIDEIRTDVKAITVPVIPTDAQPVKVASTRHFELKYYRNVPVLFITYGMVVRSIRRVAQPYFRYIGSMRNPNILYYDICTDLVILEINWNNIDIASYEHELNRNVYSLIGRAANLTDFVLRVTHTISHWILNFHPLFTGGNRWDVAEYIDVVTDESGSIIKTRIVIHDMDDGGNGISELIGYRLRDILWEAYSYARNRHRNLLSKAQTSKERAQVFLGEPGDTLIQGWPYCPLNNVALSRAAAVYFFESVLGINQRQDLDNIIPCIQ